MVERKDIADQPLEEVAGWAARSGPGSHNEQVAKAEFLLRQTQFMERQAQAAERTAVETARYSRYMLWSVVILALSSLIGVVVQLLK